MGDLKKSKLVKMICYIVFPIFILMMGLSIFHLAFLDEYGNTEATQFIDTEMFANKYMYYIVDNIQNIYNQENNGSNMYLELEDFSGNKIYYLDRDYMYSYYSGINEYIDFIIVDKETNTIYTNMRTEDYQKEIQDIKNATRYWNCSNGNIETNIDYINNNNIKYNSQYLFSELESSGYLISNKITDYEIYSKYNENKTRRTYKL